MDKTASVYRRDWTRSGIHAAQGKPVGLPEAAGDPQGTLLTLRVKEYGKNAKACLWPKVPGDYRVVAG